MKKKIALSFALALASAMPAHADVNLGVLANRGEVQAREEWTGVAESLSKSLGETVNLVTLPIDKTVDAMGSKQVDLLISNPVIEANVIEKFAAKPLATINMGGGFEFGGVILANKDSKIEKAEDMKGKKVMSYSPDSAGAYIFQVYHLKKKGIDATKDFGSFVVAKKQDDIPRAVKAGVFDAGFVRTGVLESMEKKDKLKVSDFVIVDRVMAPSGDVRTTELYPEWGIAARADADPVKVEKIKKALIGMKADDPAIQKANVKGFAEPKDLKPLTVVLKEMKVPPFDK